MNSQSDVEERSSHPAYGSEHFDTVIIGGGQAGLSVGYHLKKQGRPFVILDANERIGDSWRKRWDSLRLFTLPDTRIDGLALPRARRVVSHQGRDGRLPRVLRCPIRSAGSNRPQGGRALQGDGDRFVVASGNRRFEAERVVVATGSTNPEGSTFADELHPSIVQLHSSQYRNPSQLQEGAVLVVGAGNSGAEIAFEVSRTHPTFLSGKPSGELPVRHGPAMARFVFPVIRFVGNHVLTLRTPIGRKVQPGIHLPWCAAHPREAQGPRSSRSRAGAENRRCEERTSSARGRRRP